MNFNQALLAYLVLLVAWSCCCGAFPSVGDTELRNAVAVRSPAHLPENLLALSHTLILLSFPADAATGSRCSAPSSRKPVTQPWQRRAVRIVRLRKEPSSLFRHGTIPDSNCQNHISAFCFPYPPRKIPDT